MKQIHTVDCMDFMPTMADNSVTMTLTDIPYDGVNRESQGLRNLDKGDADIMTFDLNAFLAEAIRVTSGSLYIFCGWGQISTITDTFILNKLSTRLCVWEKTNPSPMNGQHIWLSGAEFCVYGKKRGATFNEHCKGPVWEFPTVRGKTHPTEKPVALFEYLIGVSSNPGDVVFDPCVGSGTTAVAAENLGRGYVVCDINGDYIKSTGNRLDIS